MISPGKLHLRVPRDPIENLRFRKFVLERASRDKALQKGLIEACRTDILFFINAFCLTYDPRKRIRKVGPFISFPCQERAILGGVDEDGRRVWGILECIEDAKDLCISKSRDMGASWICLMVMLWLFLFHPGMKFLMISRVAPLVDSSDPDSLFWKIDHVLEYLPDWMKPPINRTKMFYGNLANGSTITGQATTSDAGVGGRATAMFIDEFSKIPDGKSILQDTADTTDCRIFNFTHTGTDTAAYEISRRVDMRQTVLHWSMHPEKRAGLYRFVEGKIEVLDKSYLFPPDFSFDMTGRPGGKYPGLRSPWYDDECSRRLDARGIAMNLDIDPQGASDQFFDVLRINRLIATYCCPPVWVGDIEHDEAGKPIRLVERDGGPLKLWINPDADGKIRPSKFVAGVDLAWGTGATPSCMSIFDVGKGEKIGQYVNAHIEPKEYGVVAVALCWMFKSPEGDGAKLCWEQQGPGVLFGRRVLELGYRNIHYRKDDKKLPFDSQANTTPGWYPANDAKLVAFGDYREALYKEKFVNRSVEALRELLFIVHESDEKIVHSGGQWDDGEEKEAGSGRESHGDIAVADALAWKMAIGKNSAKALEDKKEEAPVGSLAWRRLIHENARDRDRPEWN